MNPSLAEQRRDVSIVERAKAGDQLAFESLYDRFSAMVHAVLLSRVRAAEVDDLSQEVFLAAWRSLSALREAEHVGAWLATIARNAAARSVGRRRHPEPLTEEVLDNPAVEPDGDAGAEALNALRRLPEAYRETLIMRLVEGLNGPEIAAATGLTHGSVRVNLTRGMKLLKEDLRKRGWQ